MPLFSSPPSNASDMERSFSASTVEGSHSKVVQISGILKGSKMIFTVGKCLPVVGGVCDMLAELLSVVDTITSNNSAIDDVALALIEVAKKMEELSDVVEHLQKGGTSGQPQLERVSHEVEVLSDLLKNKLFPVILSYKKESHTFVGTLKSLISDRAVEKILGIKSDLQSSVNRIDWLYIYSRDMLFSSKLDESNSKMDEVLELLRRQQLHQDHIERLCREKAHLEAELAGLRDVKAQQSSSSDILIAQQGSDPSKPQLKHAESGEAAEAAAATCAFVTEDMEQESNEPDIMLECKEQDLKKQIETRTSIIQENREQVKEIKESLTKRGWRVGQRQPGACVGIDLGTCYSCVGVIRHGRLEIVSNEEGYRLTPSYVTFSDTSRMFGTAAKNLAQFNPANTVYDIKRLIGRNFSDDVIQNDMNYWPFKVVEGPNDKPYVEVSYLGETRRFTPEEISAMILTNLKNSAEQYLDETVGNVVITVPAYFNNSQRQATADAAWIAGLSCLRIINEPTAAAVAYGNAESVSEAEELKSVLVFDFGGGTLDVSLLGLECNIYEVKATAGNNHLGGCDFDQAMLEYFATEIFTQHQLEVLKDKGATFRLKAACERAKRKLSTQDIASIEVEKLIGGIDFVSTMTRETFEELNLPYFQKTLEVLSEIFEPSQQDGVAADEMVANGQTVDNGVSLNTKQPKRILYSRDEVHKIVLVGGSSRIPKVQELLSNYFPGVPLCKSVNPEEVVAAGAAYQACKCSDPAETGALVNTSLDDFLLLDATSFSLGIESSGGVMDVMLKKNTTMPAKKQRTITTDVDNQTVKTIRVFEGESNLTKYCRKLGEFDFFLSPKPRGEAEIYVDFDVDANSLLTVSATEKGNKKNKKSLVINNDMGYLSDHDLRRMKLEGDLFNETDSTQ